MDTNSSHVLVVNGLTKRIGKREIVRDINFAVGQGEIYGFLGPNGAGKTTTIRMLVGLIRPTQGRIQIAGYDLSKQFLQAIRHVGCIVENPELYPYLTGRENLELFARMAEGITQQRITEVVQLVELEDRIDDRVRTYSLGMRQRLGIAQALLSRPQLLILDEPTNGLDPAGIREMRQFIYRLAREESISVFISSHILHEVQLLCDRVAIIHQGRVVKTGQVHQLLAGEPPVIWQLSPTEKAINLLKSLPDVTNVELLEDGQLRTHLPQNKIANVNHRLNQAGIQVTSIQQKKPTLEDIFLQMTEGGPLE
ncbi:ABC-2 type transport system ATP-binding protein [Marininema mesophilum]|uniref:ABC-2 type transport system ATP-binding protein n=1 Tax=Marininema mesophilum TaxID=1048340 RepID=A0A1H2SB70_9BACL|nr:ABC transporter ATP-binding protein [Marininema mesophilum]SDW28249.1 ABC-2 type transport system ATP-binding protein [Marininema mesophilum]